jgi:hypothetical protein
MKAYWWVEVWFHFLTSALYGAQLSALPPGKESPITHWIVGYRWDPEPVWTRWWIEKFPAPVGTRSPDHPALYRRAIPAPSPLPCSQKSAKRFNAESFESYFVQACFHVPAISLADPWNSKLWNCKEETVHKKLNNAVVRVSEWR